MNRRIGDLLAQRAREAFIGRSAELEALLSMLDGGPQVVFVHGIAGIGKSTLLEAFAEQARARGATVVRLDCRGIEPTERGFLRELGVAIGSPAGAPEQAAERLGTLGSRVVLSLDTYEVFRLMDTWLRQVFLTLLPENVRVVLAGRDRPVSSWLTTPGWQGMLRTLALGPLGEPEAIELLAISGVGPDKAGRIQDLARGHPLALKLAASAATEWPSTDAVLGHSGFQRVVEELTRIYLADVRDRLTRQALEASSVVRRATVSLLQAMLPDAAPQDMFERLRVVPFVESEGDGLHMHDLVQQAIAASVRAVDPNRYQAYRRAAWRQLNEEIQKASQLNLWRYTADLLYLIENPAVREAFFPSGAQQFVVEPARAEDGAAIKEIIQRHEAPSAAGRLAEWWRSNPGFFRAVREQSGDIAGFYCMFDPATLSSDNLETDPISRQWRQHLRDNPTPKNQRALFIRRWLSRERGEAPSPVQAACWLDIKRSYMGMRPHLRRVYLTVNDLALYAPAAQKLGLQPITGAETELDGVRYHTAMLDFGPLSVDGWLAGLVADELGVEGDDLLDVESHELVLGARRVKLTKMEFDVFLYLYERENKPVTRVSLIEQVWGAKCTGSNVIEAVMRSLRKKLGDRAMAIETIRNVGYRFRRDCASSSGEREIGC
jgi:AAA ATPase-like protein